MEFDRTVRLQVLLQRAKAGLVLEAVTTAGDELTEILAGVLANSEVAEMSPSRLEEFISSLDRRLGAALDLVWLNLYPQLKEIAQQMAEAEAEILDVAVPDLRSLGSDAVRKPVLADGMAAPLLAGIFVALVDDQVRRLTTAVRTGAARRDSNRDLLRRIVGPRSRNNRGALIGTTLRRVSAFADLAVQHSAEQARQTVWMQSAGVSRYRWSVILDSRTCLQCGPLDGNVYEVGSASPLPPLHPRCRCFAVAMTDEDVDRSRGTRPAQGGEVRADLTYYDWLKRQDAEFQAEAIGKTRAKLLRSGGLSSKQFKDLQLDRDFEPLTLEEMKKLRPLAFERAGID